MTLDLDRFGTRKLNIGCGFDVRQGYINVDLQGFHKPDIVASVLDLNMISPNWAEELIASDLLEHIGRSKTLSALCEWNRVLIIGGRMWLRTTYLPGLLKRMSHPWFGDLKSHKALINDAFSTQAYEGDFHFTAFTEKLMRFYVWAAGFEMKSLTVQDEWLFVVEADKVLDYSFADLMNDDLPDQEFVSQLYHRLLYRDADQEGLCGKLDLIASGTSRLAIVRGFLASDEREEKMIERAPTFNLCYDAS